VTRRHHPFAPLASLATRLLSGEAGAGVLLIAVAGAALLAANSPLASAYHALFHAALPWTPLAKLSTLHLWINDALMALFFFVVGLEIKREVLDGELATPARRRLLCSQVGRSRRRPTLPLPSACWRWSAAAPRPRSGCSC
jgi:NhaA family Na+:H+ antiporter